MALSSQVRAVDSFIYYKGYNMTIDVLNSLVSFVRQEYANPGVYVIHHTQTGRFYVGSAGNVPERLSTHRNRLRSGTHENRHLQAAYNDSADLTFTTMLTTSRETAFDREQATLDFFRGSPALFNIGVEDVRVPSKGVKRSDETREKIALSKTGLIHTAEHRQNISQALKGVPKPPGFSEHLREVNLNHPRRAELNANLSDTRWSGDNPHAKGVSINGVLYGSGSEAARALGLSRSVFSRRLDSPNYPTYVRL